MRGFPLVHRFGAAFVNRALGIAHDDIAMRHAERLEQFDAGNGGGASAIHDHFDFLDVTLSDIKTVDKTCGGDDSRAMLVVMEYGDIHNFAETLLDHKAIRRTDIFQINAAERWAEETHAIDKLFDILGIDFKIDAIDIGKAFEQNRLAFHHWLGC